MKQQQGRRGPPFMWIWAALLGLSGCAAYPSREPEVRAQLPAEARWAASLWGAAIPGGEAAAGAGTGGGGGNDTGGGAGTDIGGGAGEDATLSAEAAVRLAFGENPRARLLRAEFLKEMAAVDAAAASGGLAWSWTRLRPEVGLAQLALSLSLPLDEWLQLPARRRQAFWDRTHGVQRAAWETLQFEHDVRIAWATAVGTAQRSGELATAAEVAGLAAELATRYHEAGSLARREVHAAELQAGEALAAAATASVAAEAARAELATLLGLSSGDTRLRLPAALPVVPSGVKAGAEAGAGGGVETGAETGEAANAVAVQKALQRRLDLRAARSAVIARQLEAARVQRWARLPKLQAGAEREREADGAHKRGPAVEGEWSPAGLAEAGVASATVAAAQAEAEALAVQVANEVVLRRVAFRRAAEVAALQAVRLVPAQQQKLQETQRRQNFMLEGPFGLLEERRHAAELAAALAERQLEAWVAWQNLQQAMGDAP